MSGFDDLYSAVLADRLQRAIPDEHGRTHAAVDAIEAFDLRAIGAALDKARAAEGQPIPEHYALPDYPGQMLELRVGGREIGSHGLVGAGRDTAYLAQSVVPDKTPPLRIEPRRWVRDVREEAPIRKRWGKEIIVGLEAFDDRFVLRSRSRRAAATLLDEGLVAALLYVGRSLVSVTLTPEQGQTYVEVKVLVGKAADGGPAVTLARAAWTAAERLASAPGGFADEEEAHALSAEALKALVERVQTSTSFLAGHVERSGDGIEARFELDRPEGLKGILRIEPTGEDTVRASLRGDLLLPPDRKVRLSPEVGMLMKARGLFDPKVGNELLDKAFLIEGDLESARLALSDPAAALRIAGRGGSLALDGQGLLITVPSFAADDLAFLEVTAACVAAWREAALRNAGLSEYAVERS